MTYTEEFIILANASFDELDLGKLKTRSVLKTPAFIEGTRKVLDINGKWRNMPPDDGYDEAFFMFLSNPLQSFESLVYRTRVNARVFYDKLTSCGYSPEFEIGNIDLTKIGVEEYARILFNHFNGKGEKRQIQKKQRKV